MGIRLEERPRMPEEKQSDLEANFPRMVSCEFGTGGESVDS